jgi:hypothetical protein
LFRVEIIKRTKSNLTNSGNKMADKPRCTATITNEDGEEGRCPRPVSRLLSGNPKGPAPQLCTTCHHSISKSLSIAPKTHIAEKVFIIIIIIIIIYV